MQYNIFIIFVNLFYISYANKRTAPRIDKIEPNVVCVTSDANIQATIKGINVSDTAQLSI